MLEYLAIFGFIVFDLILIFLFLDLTVDFFYKKRIFEIKQNIDYKFATIVNEIREVKIYINKLKLSNVSIEDKSADKKISK